MQPADPAPTQPTVHATNSDSISVKTDQFHFVTIVALLLVVGAGAFYCLHFYFPIFKPATELLIPFPPDEIAVARENAFSRGRLTNSLLFVGVCSLVAGLLLPISARSSGRQSRFGFSILLALSGSIIACLGVVFAHLVMEFTTTQSWGVSRTFAAHWLEFGFFGAGVCFAVGAIVGGLRSGIVRAQRGAAAGVASATVFGIICVMIPRAQIDMLIPGGVLWGNKDSVALCLWLAGLLLTVAFAMLGSSRRTDK